MGRLILNPSATGRPNLIISPVTVTPQALYIWQDDFDTEVAEYASQFVPSAGIQIGMEVIVFQPAQVFGTMPVGVDIVQKIVTANSEARWFVTEPAPYDDLDIEGDMCAQLVWMCADTEEPWSRPLYSISGQTKDMDTLALIPGATVRAFRAATNGFHNLAVSDGGANYSIPVFDQEDYMLVAHVGQSPAGVTRRDVKGA